MFQGKKVCFVVKERKKSKEKAQLHFTCFTGD